MKLVWFRRDLRTVDNTALQRAITSGETVCALYIATPEQWHRHQMSPIQADLIYRQLGELQSALRRLNVPLLYEEVASFADSVPVIKQVVLEGKVDEVLCNAEYELNEQRRDELVAGALRENGTDFQCLHDKCIQIPGALKNQQGEYYRVFTPFKKAWLSRLTPPVIVRPEPAPYHELPLSLEAMLMTSSMPYHYPRESSDAWSVDYESIRQALRDFSRDAAGRYHQQRDFPGRNGTSRLSPYLAIGSLSARQCLARLYLNTVERNWNDGEMTWLNELIWREFYQHLLWFRSDISQRKSFHAWGDRLEWHHHPGQFERWCEGQTGFPIVDAAMRQLNQTGWMHNRLRMIVASFLVKDLHINWRRGEDYFMSRLIDGDFAANNGGWQWCASTGCDGQPYFRIFNPTSQSEKFDPEGTFIRQWIPELASVPLRYLHQPHAWSGFGAVGYPAPMVDHKSERALTLHLYKQAKGESS